MASTVSVGSDICWVKIEKVVRDDPRDKAVLFRLALQKRGVPRDLWVPRDVIVDRNAEYLGIKSWWARQKHLKSEW